VGITPLIFAIQKNNIEAVNMLIQHGVDVSEKSGAGHSPLYYALQAKGEVMFKIIEALVSNPKNTNAGTGPEKTGSCQDNCCICSSSDDLWMDDPGLIDLLGPLLVTYCDNTKKKTQLKALMQCAVVRIINSLDLSLKSSTDSCRYDYTKPTITSLLIQVISRYAAHYKDNNQNIKKEGSSGSLDSRIMNHIIDCKGDIGKLELDGRPLLSHFAEYGCIDLIQKLASNPFFLVMTGIEWPNTTVRRSFMQYTQEKQNHSLDNMC